MSSGQRVGLLVGAGLCALAVAMPSAAREPVRGVPMAAIAAVPDRNISDFKSGPIVGARAVPTPQLGELSVIVDRAKVIRLPEKTQTVIVGNPSIADLAVQKNGVVVLTGKSFGVTNFIALDANGALLAESMVSVAAPADSTMIVQRGFERQTYSCTPTCQPSVVLGDANGYFGEVKGQVDAHTSFATQR